MSTRNIRGPLFFNQTTTILTGGLTITNESVVVVNKTAGATTAITLPASSTAADGRRRVIYVVDGKGDSNSNAITISRAGADTINGATTFVLNVAYGSVRLVDCGSGVWQASIFTDASTTSASATITTLTATNGTVTTLNSTTLTSATIAATGLTTLAANSAVAGAGTVIGNATAIAVNVVHVTGADDTVGVRLPATTAGQAFLVYSANATNGLKVYPPVNSSINGGTANAAVAIEGKTLALFVATNATNYAGIYTANS